MGQYPFLRGGVAVLVNPVKEINRVDVLWAMPPTRGEYRANPSRLLGHLLGHEGVGSPFAHLQGLGWITGLSAGTRTSFVDFSIFQVSLSVTPLGLEQWRQAVEVLYAHIHLIKQMSDDDIQRAWREEKACDDLEFMFQMKQSGRELAAGIAENSLRCAPEHVLSYGYLRDDLVDPSLVRNFLSRLVPGEEVCMISSKMHSWIASDDAPHGTSVDSNKCDAAAARGEMANRVEPWYGVHYFEESILESDLEKWRNPCLAPVASSLNLPAENKYIPYTLLESDAVTRQLFAASNSVLRNFPVLVDGGHDSMRGKCWWSQDLTFGHPRTCLFLLLEPQNLEEPTCRTSQLNALAKSLFAQITASERYPSTIAGLHNHVAWTYRGLEVRCSGYSPKLSFLLRDVLGDIKSFLRDSDDGTARVLDNVKEKHMRALRSWKHGRPDSICAGALTVLLQDHTWFPGEQLEAVTEVNMAAIQEMTTGLLRGACQHIFYSHGDLSREATCELYSEVVDGAAIVYDPQPVPEYFRPRVQRARLLPRGKGVEFVFCAQNPRDTNSALVCHFQAGDSCASVQTDALLLVLNRLLKEPLFTELRTRQQLGYIVSMSQDSHGRGYGNCVGGLTVNILSKRFHPLHIKDALGTFLATQREFIAGITESQLKCRVSAIISNLRELSPTYSHEASRNWGRLVDGYPLDYKLQVISNLENLTLEAVLCAADEWIFSPTTRRCVLLMMCAESHKDDMKRAFGTESYRSSEYLFFNTSVNPLGDANAFNELRDVYITRQTLEYPCVNN